MVRGFHWSSAHIDKRMAFGQMLHLKCLQQDRHQNPPEANTNLLGHMAITEDRDRPLNGEVTSEKTGEVRIVLLEEFSIDKEVQLEISFSLCP